MVINSKYSCPKCGNNDLAAQFYVKGEIVGGQLTKRSHQRTVQKEYHRECTEDHIHLHCRFCHYQWTVLPLNDSET